MQSFGAGVLSVLSSDAVGDAAQEVPEITPASICPSWWVESTTGLGDVRECSQYLGSGFIYDFMDAIAQIFGY